MQYLQKAETKKNISQSFSHCSRKYRNSYNVQQKNLSDEKISKYFLDVP
jgi:hypothetical protein